MYQQSIFLAKLKEKSSIFFSFLQPLKIASYCKGNVINMNLVYIMTRFYEYIQRGYIHGCRVGVHVSKWLFTRQPFKYTAAG